MSRAFAVVSPSALVISLPVVLVVEIFAELAALGILQRPQSSIALPVLAIGGLLLMIVMRQSRVTLDHRALSIAAGLNTRCITVAELELDDARVVDLAEHTELRPKFQTNGSSLFGYTTGDDRLRDGSAAFLLLTARSRVIALREKTASAC